MLSKEGKAEWISSGQATCVYSVLRVRSMVEGMLKLRRKHKSHTKNVLKDCGLDWTCGHPVYIVPRASEKNKYKFCMYWTKCLGNYRLSFNIHNKPTKQVKISSFSLARKITFIYLKYLPIVTQPINRFAGLCSQVCLKPLFFPW